MLPEALPALLLIVVGDVLLGSMALAGGLVRPAGAAAGAVGDLVAVALSPAFLLVTAAEILLLALLATRGVDLRLRALLSSQAAVVFLSPTTFGYASWSWVAAVLGSTILVALFVTALQYMYRVKQLAPVVSRFLLWWTVAAAVSGAGWFLWRFEGSPYLLVVAVLVQLGVAVNATLRTGLVNREQRVPWLLHPFWVFGLLLSTFLAEFFLGALLDLTIAGPGFLQYIPFVPPTGTGLTLTAKFVYNGLWFGSAILASAWFLILLGFTMGPLVVFKMRETHERAQKYRLGLTVVVFGLATIYIPSLTSSTPLANIPWLQSIPVIGWGFGLRDGGPFESGVFLAVILMYVSVGVLTLLFGRKALCSVMCGAAMLYQGTAINEMRQFNQTSRVGKYFLGSQLSTAYVAASGVALVSLFGISLASYLHMLPAVQVANGQFDTAALPLPVMLYFGGIWFAMFVTVPFLGTYNCATTGFCHWGALSIPFAKVGFFKLKVKDRKVCQACTTFDCAKACPVALVDMPLHFRTKGEFKSSKCCGVGDCVEACPYGNMYHQDVRFWIRRKLTGRDPVPRTPAPRGIPLPMVPVSKAVPPPQAAQVSD
jgi:polyferredoxin